MILAPSPLGKKTLSRPELETDLKRCRRFGPCGLGDRALYLGGRFLERRFYVPWKEVKRVFKRVAMTSGGFSGKGIFGSMAFLVVQFGNGLEKDCPFKREADLDRLLDRLAQEHPDVPTHSAQAAKKLAAAAAAEEARYRRDLTPQAQAAVESLRKAQKYLERRVSLCDAMTAAARQKRVADNMNPAYRIGGAAAAVAAILAAAYGLFALLTQRPYGGYFLAGGAALFFFALSTNTMPNRWNSKKRAQQDWDVSLDRVREYTAERELGFPVPAQYAHPVVLERMIRVVREGRAETESDALRVVKDDLKALNSSVTVSQKEHDEVVKVKPLFLVCDYRDEI